MEVYDAVRTRLTVRQYKSDPVPDDVVMKLLKAAQWAPSSRNLQPWHFIVISDPAIKRQIREAAEEEERAFYDNRATDEWLEVLAPHGTDPRKPFLDTAPYLIVIFGQSYEPLPDGRKRKHYYVQESVGIATGMLITAVHHAGLASLTHTPSPMGFLTELLGRPKWERPFLLLVVGYPADDARVPTHAMQKKSLDEITTFM